MSTQVHTYLGRYKLVQRKSSDYQHRASNSSGSTEDILQQASTNRASLSLSIDLQDIANDYRASIQEMETARLEAENEASYEPPPWDSRPDEMGEVDSIAMNAQQDPELREMIATAEEEIRSLRPSSSVYSDSTASIYSSLSRHSMRMSVIIDELPMTEVMNASERRKSRALTIRNSISVPSTLSSVPEAHKWRQTKPSTDWHQRIPQPPIQEDPERAFKDLCMFPRPYFLINFYHLH